MHIYPRLKDLREDADKKQSEVAQFLNMEQSQYSKYERGAREIPFHKVIELAKFYNVSLDFIAGLTNEKKSLE